MSIYKGGQKCPIWYNRLNEKNKKHIKNVIGDATSSNIDLENTLIDETGAQRSDVKELLKWWFNKNVFSFFFSSVVSFFFKKKSFSSDYFFATIL